MKIPTPHIDATNKEQIAKTVLMPGDPLRAEFIAKTFLEDVECYNKTRNMLGFTGKYKNKLVSVQGSGMGVASMGIYAYELFNFYDVQNIIRIGTAGGMNKDIKLRDVIIANAACTDTGFLSQYGLPGTFAPTATYALVEQAVKVAKEKNIEYTVGTVLTSDFFYGDNKSAIEDWQKMNVLAAEMECASLFATAARASKNALGILTISDNIVTGENTTAKERETNFTNMMEIALEVAICESNL